MYLETSPNSGSSGGMSITSLGGPQITGGSSEQPDLSEQEDSANQSNTQDQYHTMNDSLHGGLVGGGDGTSGVDYGGGDNDSPSGSDDTSTGDPNNGSQWGEFNPMNPSASYDDGGSSGGSNDDERPTTNPLEGTPYEYGQGDTGEYGVIDLGQDGPGGGTDYDLPTDNDDAANDGQVGVVDFPDSLDSVTDGSGVLVDTTEQAQAVNAAVSDAMQSLEDAVSTVENPNQDNQTNQPTNQQTQLPAWLQNAFLSGPWAGNDGGGLGATTIALGGLAVVGIGLGVMFL